MKWKGGQEPRAVYEDFSGGVVTDNPLRKKNNELLQATNVIVNTNGGFEKRKGSEILSSGVGLDSESDIWGIILYNEHFEGEYDVWFFFEETEKDYIIKVDVTSIGYDGGFDLMNNWAAAVTNSGTEYIYGYHVYSPEAIGDTGEVSNAILEYLLDGADGSVNWPSFYGQMGSGSHWCLRNGALDEKTNVSLTLAELQSLNYCWFGLWENVAEAASKTITTYYNLSLDKVNSTCQLNRRDTDDNSISRILMSTYYQNNDTYRDIGKLVKLNTSGTTLTISSTTELYGLWASGKPSWAVYQNRAFMVNGISPAVTAPTVAPTEEMTEDDTGALADGTYKIKYSYVRVDDDGTETESELNTTELSFTTGGDPSDDNQSVDVGVTYTTDSTVDKIRIYRTKVDETSPFYFDTEVDNDTNGGTVTVRIGKIPDKILCNWENTAGRPARIWTDGTNVYQIGVDAPTVEPASVAIGASGGNLGDGDYQIAYSYKRSTEYGAESNILAYSSTVSVSEGDTNNKITGDITYSSDTQVDKVRLYRTKVGGAIYYYESEIDNVVGTGTVEATWGSLADNSLTTLASNSGAGNDNDRPPASTCMTVNADRAFYATENHVYYSKVGYPEQVPADNLRAFDPDDGEKIINIAAFKKYIVVQKSSKTWLLDANYPDQLKPILLSSTIGCVEPNTFKVCASGQVAIWLSQEGFFMTDGAQIKSICEYRIYRDLAKNIDKSNTRVSRAIYYPNDQQYICYVPYLNSKYRIWVYTIPLDNWVKFEYPFRPHAIALWSDTNDIKRFIIGTVASGVEGSRRSYFGHYIQGDKDNHYKDVLYTGTCASATTTYQNITSTIITSWDVLGVNEMDKQFHAIHTEWYAGGSTTATITVRADYGRRTASCTISHAGIENEPSDSEWWLGYDYVEGWDYQIIESDPKAIPLGVVTGTSDSQEVLGRNVSIKFTETSDKELKVFLLTLVYRLLGRRDE